MAVVQEEYPWVLQCVPNRRYRSVLSIFLSAVSTLALNVVVWSLLIRVSSAGNEVLGSYWLAQVVWYSWWFLGISQLLYLVPLVFWLMDRRRFNAIIGIGMGAFVTLLFNGLLLSNVPSGIR